MKQKSKVVVIGAIRNQNRQFLISQRIDPKIPEAHLKWDFIGGKNEFGEKLEDTMIREAKEEAGISIKIEEFLPIHFHKMFNHEEYLQHTLVFCFLCSTKSTRVRLGDHKINELKWISLEEIDDYTFLPTTRELFANLKI